MALGHPQAPGLNKSHQKIFPNVFSIKIIGLKVILMPYITSKPTILNLNFIKIGILFPMGGTLNPRPFIRCTAETSKNIMGATTVKSLRNTVLTLSLKLVSIGYTCSFVAVIMMKKYHKVLERFYCVSVEI